VRDGNPQFLDPGSISGAAMPPSCGSKHSEVSYNRRYQRLPRIIKRTPNSFWHYFPLPAAVAQTSHREQGGKEPSPWSGWTFLEEFAKREHGLNIQVHVYRNDLNGGTGTLQGHRSLIGCQPLQGRSVSISTASPSTGNSATAYAMYLSMAGVNCSVFMPEDALKASEGHH